MNGGTKIVGSALGVGAVAALFVALAVEGRYAAVAEATWETPALDLAASSDPTVIARGRYLAQGLARCAECHGEDLGGRLLSAGPFARLPAPNLTPGRGGVADWSHPELGRAIRHGVDREGRGLWAMPVEAHVQLSDTDLVALVSYLRALPPIDRETGEKRMGPGIRLATALGRAGPKAAQVDHSSPSRPRPGPEATPVQRGTYLAAIAGCAACHGADLQGGGVADAPDLRGLAPLQGWTRTDFDRALRDGLSRDGTTLHGMPSSSFAGASADDLDDLWAYLSAR